MMKKQNIYAVLAFALIMAVALVVGCSITILDPPAPKTGIEEAVVGPLEEGMGVVRLNFNEETGSRTILPTAGSRYTLDDFNHFILEFTGGTAPKVTIQNTSKAARETPFPLAVGNYTKLVVTAYLTGNESQPGAIFTKSTTTSVNDGVSTPISISLAYFDPSEKEEEGIFSWTITPPTTAMTAGTITLTPIGGGTAIPITFLGNLSDSSDILEGYYNVRLEAQQAGNKKCIVTDTLHVYRFMTSAFSFTLKDGHFFVMVPTGGTGGWVDLEDIEDGSPTVGGSYTWSLVTDFETPKTITVTDSTDFNSLTWVLTNTTEAGTTVGTTGSISLDGTSAPFNAVGIYLVTITGVKTDDGKTYSRRIEIELTNTP